MYVNPFWFGVLMTVVGLVVVMIILAIITVHRDDKLRDEEDEADFQKFLEEVENRKFKLVRKDGYWVGEPVEDDDDDDDHAQSD